MMRTLRRPLLLLLPAPALTSAACGTERAHAGASADRAELDARARYMQSAIELIRVTEVDGPVVRLSAERATVDRETLRRAVESAHPATDTELDALLPEQTAPASPVERGDLPPVGDGAPNNSVPEGASG
ncbi:MULTISPECIES: hypothetical protein [unclassified Streptomyces]|uniref:hypothetical protein n=1 Tax=unclassified Streptomyces TaxID=2593676 RepID=UPI00081F2116|nr:MULTISPECIES: hypothetical protein [unclassified Streptomyces]MYZ39069.1 hypothetical protein [Streptomyces sp. SID4917]SCG01962.1 hypothetical protein GA0115259_107584 [Streptomyces sp. MnatMP-M17]